jgi:hypothetical protein
VARTSPRPPVPFPKAGDRVRLWNRRMKYEDRNRALGLCTRSKQHGQRDPRSKNLCAACLKSAREQERARRRRSAKVLPFVPRWQDRWAA